MEETRLNIESKCKNNVALSASMSSSSKQPFWSCMCSVEHKVRETICPVSNLHTPTFPAVGCILLMDQHLNTQTEVNGPRIYARQGLKDQVVQNE